MIRINLLPAEILIKAQRRQRVLQATMLGAVFLGLVMLVSIGLLIKLKRQESQLAQGQDKLKKLEVIVAKVDAIEKTAAAVRARLDVINDLLKSRPLYPYFMSDFARSVPTGVRVRNLSTAGGGSSAGTLKLTMSAEARANEDIARWIRHMEDSGKFSSVELGPVTLMQGGDRLYSFTLTSTYTPKL